MRRAAGLPAWHQTGRCEGWPGGAGGETGQRGDVPCGPSGARVGEPGLQGGRDGVEQLEALRRVIGTELLINCKMKVRC